MSKRSPFMDMSYLLAKRAARIEEFHHKLHQEMCHNTSVHTDKQRNSIVDAIYDTLIVEFTSNSIPEVNADMKVGLIYLICTWNQ